MTKNFLLVCAVVLLSGCLPFSPERNRGPANGGIARSADGGQTFERRNVIDSENSLNQANITAIAVDPRQSDIVYAGTQRNGLYISRDAGAVWSLLPFEGRDVSDIAIDPRDSDIIYVASPWEGRGSLFRSADAGESWERIYVEPVSNTIVSTVTLLPQNPDHIYIGTSVNSSRKSAIVRSLDSGQTWDNILTESSTIEGISFDPFNPDQIYVHASSNRLLRSDDGGAVWEDFSRIRRDREDRYEGTVYSFFVHPRNAGELYVGTDRSLYRSDNYGDTWREVDIIGTSRGIPIRAISVSPVGGDQLMYASAQALYVLVRGEQWSITDTESRQVISVIAHDPLQSGVVYTGFHNVSE